MRDAGGIFCTCNGCLEEINYVIARELQADMYWGEPGEMVGQSTGDSAFLCLKATGGMLGTGMQPHLHNTRGRSGELAVEGLSGRHVNIDIRMCEELDDGEDLCADMHEISRIHPMLYRKLTLGSHEAQTQNKPPKEHTNSRSSSIHQNLLPNPPSTSI